MRNSGPRPVTISTSVSNLSNGPAQIPSSSVDLKYVLTWYQAPGAWTKSRRTDKTWNAELVPELLANDPRLVVTDPKNRHNYLRLQRPAPNEYALISERRLSDKHKYPSTRDFPVSDVSEFDSIDLQPVHTQQYWLTIKVPDDASPGVYKGTIQLRAADGLSASLPIRLTVLNFRLEDSSIEYSIYYRGKLAPNHPTISHEWKNEPQLLADLVAMAEHGISNPTCYQRLHPKFAIERDRTKTTKELLERHLKFAEQRDLEGRPSSPSRPNDRKKHEQKGPLKSGD